MRFAIIDYGMGNLRSVRNALEFVGAEVAVAERGQHLSDADAVVLPGVGAFGRGMEGLRDRGFVDALQREVRERKKPMLGICLGLQLFARWGRELGDHEGLGWVDGEVTRLPQADGIRVPHIGWNDVAGTGPLFEGIPSPSAFYFVHSYRLVASDDSIISGRSEHGVPFVAAISFENVHAVQFHPEKSHKYGIQLLRNFVSIARKA